MVELYKVFETDADLSMDPHHLKYCGTSRSMAEAKMDILFHACDRCSDFLIWDAINREIIGTAFSDKTRGLLNEHE